MLINLRNALMAGKRLPYDAEVEFLESTGTQYIDTGVVNAVDVDISCNFTCNASGSATRAIFGAYYPSLTKQRMASAYSGWNTVAAKMYVYLGASSLVDVANNDINNVTMTGSKCYFNGSEVYSSANFTGSELTLWLFAANNSVSNHYPFTGRIYSCKIWKNGVLVRDYIPVRKGTVGYLYDRVSGKLFGNAGTGDFVLGPDVVPVEYIESFIGSEGGQYINTGILATTSTKWEIDIAFTITTTGQLMGSGYSGNQRFNIGIESSAFRGGFGGGWFTISNTPDTNRHLWRLESLSATQCEASIDGGAAVSYTSTFSPASSPILLSKRRMTDSSTRTRYYASKIWTSGDLVQNLRPIRVGTDATSWEGAMMDVLTRRIYRNAGTGAFTYGNDLKYPIPTE